LGQVEIEAAGPESGGPAWVPFWRAVLWRRNVRQRAEQQPDEDLCAEQIDSARSARALQRLRQGTNARPGCGSMTGRKESCSQGGRCLRVTSKFDSSVPLSLLPSPFGGTGISGEHSPLQ
jgi:hypothetical protein